MHLPDFRNLGSVQTRANALRWMKRYTFSPLYSSLSWLLCVLFAYGVTLLPPVKSAIAESGMSAEAVWMLRIALLAAGLWLTEAIPAYATAMLVMALEILFLSTATGSELWEWSSILAVWGSPLIWLFFGGFLIAESFRQVGLDRRAAKFILLRSGSSYLRLTFGLMLVTFFMSMFMSNTATVTVVVGLVTPLIARHSEHALKNRGLLLGLAVAATLGGMVTIVGTPPNAIAIATLAEAGHSVDFLSWMLLAGPPAIILLIITGFYLKCVYFKGENNVRFDTAYLEKNTTDEGSGIRRFFVISVVLATIGMWLTQSVHGVSPTVVVFLAVTLLTLSGILSSASLRTIPWDTLMLMAGGLALGRGVTVSGLADSLATFFPKGIEMWMLALAFCFIAVVTSNFMSNTAAANALLPIIISVAPMFSLELVIPTALACSCAVLLPVSTPPNAICYSTGYLRSRDFKTLGFLFIVLGPLVTVAWVLIN